MSPVPAARDGRTRLGAATAKGATWLPSLAADGGNRYLANEWVEVDLQFAICNLRLTITDLAALSH